jgi:hypothetical protein
VSRSGSRSADPRTSVGATQLVVADQEVIDALTDEAFEAGRVPATRSTAPALCGAPARDHRPRRTLSSPLRIYESSVADALALRPQVGRDQQLQSRLPDARVAHANTGLSWRRILRW